MGMTPMSFVEAAVPLDETSDASLDGRPRPKAEISFDIRGIGPRCRDIARLKRKEVYLGFSPESLLDRLYKLHQVDRLAVPDIIDSVGRF